MGKNTSFSNTGCFPYTINKGFPIEKRNDSIILNITGTKTIEEYAIKMAQYYFEHNPPAKSDDFIRKYMDHQHYCKKSCGYDTFPKGYKSKNGIIVDGKELPDHFTLLLDWTKDEQVAKGFAGVDGTILSIDLEKYIKLVGDNYKMSYSDEIIEIMLIDTAEQQKSIVTFWPWTFTINELENNELGEALNFSIKKLNEGEV
jgi:hypothetical protein